ncbi:cardiolipin synthase [Novosphingobium sp. Rr 2-17]|uniref:cardiolipin synthase n=1 Tax=Novosphingobium sp. Rr 2-17 TaxID=555793 RepID=UPI0002698B92|nr:cardiolipin synthase [Novosphingobium sp. Rr 2-17]EIZ80057.1 cardiolipin synthase [Novosphingobium sp. Rr 2-17]
MSNTPIELGQVYYTAEWIIRLAMLAVVPFRRTPAATRSWLLLIFFLPVLGLLLFLAIGTPRFPSWRTERFARLQPFFLELSGRLQRAAPVEQHAACDVIGLAQRLGLFPAVGGNTVELLDDYDRVIDTLVADIDRACAHVRILVYIFADDDTGLRVISALERAVKRNVVCHVLLDPVGSGRWTKDVLARLGEAGVHARATLPFRLLRARTRRDMRNHRKLFSIDGKVAYAGSQNIVAKDFRPGVTNRELVARVTGPVVAAIDALFLADWYMETEELLDAAPLPSPISGTSQVQVLPSGADYRHEGFLTLLTWQVHQATGQVVIVTPYLIPDEGLLAAMATAVLRGVEVHIVVSRIADQKLVSLAQASYYEELLSQGVHIHRYPHYLLHAKSIRIDDRLGIIGSSNVDIRSFQLNEEISLLLLDGPTIASLKSVQDEYIGASGELRLEDWRQRHWLRKFAENGARLISPLL